MRHILSSVLTGALLLGCFTANAQFGRRDPYSNRDPYGRGRGGYGYGDSGLIRSVADDVRRASSSRGGFSLRRTSRKDHKRYDNALKHLSEFDSKLSRGHFDRGKLDHAIDDVNNIVRHNHIDRRDRDMLAMDVERLREFRARYRY
jgi:hypothetical protein